MISFLLAFLATGSTLGTQVPPEPSSPDDWNSPRVLALVEQAREARRSREVPPGEELESYEAQTEGHIYFYVDPDEGTRALIRVDQVAVDLFWEAPNRVRQRIVGERSETFLPVRDFNYYLDRLTLIQYGMGDEIRVGQGLDVANVPHPLRILRGGQSEDEVYDFRMGDALTLSLAGVPEPLRIREVEVRPKDQTDPAVVGTIFLAERDGALVRMELSFTPSAYVDRRNDWVRIELDYGLWDGIHWLPNSQVIEVRREVPELDLGLGTVIRAVLRVGGYELNTPIPPEIMAGPSVQAVPQAARARWEFSEGLMDGLARDGLAGTDLEASPARIRRELMDSVENRPGSGLSAFRLHLPRHTSIVGHDRTRGWDLGAGASFRPSGTWRARVDAGWSVGASRPRAGIELDRLGLGPWALMAELRLNGRHDLGTHPPAPILLSSFSSVLLDEDWMDPWRWSGGRLTGQLERDGGDRIQLHGGVETHRSEHQRVGSEEDRRPVRPVAEGTFGVAGASLERPLERLPAFSEASWSSEFHGLVGSEDQGARLQVGLDGRRTDPADTRSVQLRLAAGTVLGSPMPQLHRLLGGRESLPGFEFHAFEARSWATGRIQMSREVHGPHLHLRGGLHAARADGKTPLLWDTEGRGTEGVRGGVTAGVGTLWNLVHIDVARGIGGGEWQLLISVDPQWWFFL